MKRLGANVLRGPDQKPWDGKLQYDYQLWITKILYSTLRSSINWYYDKDIATVGIGIEDGQNYCCTLDDEEDFRGNGGVMNHETLESIANKPFTVDYAGFGWLPIKNGI